MACQFIGGLFYDFGFRMFDFGFVFLFGFWC